MNAPVESPAAKALERGFELGTIRIDPRSGGASGPGGVVKLDPKVMAVLVVLAEHASQVVSREVLLSRIWPGVIVGDEVLSRCIYELRRQLNQAAGSDQLKDAIETLPKRGYRLKLDVTPIPSEGSAAPSGRRPLLIIAAALAVIAAVLVGLWKLAPLRESAPSASATSSVAVLPFVDMSPGKDQAYLADGFSEEILNRLAQSRNLRVIARTSSFALRDPALDVAEIAKRLQVSHVLEGSVRKSGDTIRITAQLISASDSSHVWSNTYDRQIGDVFTVQDEIARAVATALETTLYEAASVPQSTINVEAYEKFLQGEFLYYRRAPGDMKQAARYYEEAVALDPRFARAWASLSGAYSMLDTAIDEESPNLQSRQGQAAQRAVELDPNLAVVHVRLANFYGETGEHEKADEHFRRAAALDPDEPSVMEHAIGDAIDRGDLDKAIALQSQMVARNPLLATIRNNLAVYLLADGQLEKALSQFRQVQEIHPETDPHVAIDIVHVLILQDRFDEAQAEMSRVPAGNLRNQGLALLHAATGREAEADAAVEQLVKGSKDIMDSVRLAEVYAFRGMADEAFEVLAGKKQALAHEHGTDSGHVWYLTHESRMSPFLKALQSDPRWSTFVAFPS